MNAPGAPRSSDAKPGLVLGLTILNCHLKSEVRVGRRRSKEVKGEMRSN